jgi:cytochrome c5
MMSLVMRLALIVALVAVTASCKSRDVPALPPVASHQLRAVADFAVVTDKKERSRALFLEASRVLLNPRCANCHPDGDVPSQGMQMVPHQPPVTRGPEGRGVVGMECTSCHQDRNLVQARVPGAADWHLAPREMAWVGKSARQVCEQVKDPKRNGGKSLADIVEHNAHDKNLVAWGWSPGSDREPAPGSQEQFGAIVAAWVETGAECPGEEVRR